MMSDSGVMMLVRDAGGENMEILRSSCFFVGIWITSSCLIQDPSGYGLNEHPRLIAYTGFVGIWRPHFLAYLEFRRAILHLFHRPEFVGFCDLKPLRKIKLLLVYFNGD